MLWFGSDGARCSTLLDWYVNAGDMIADLDACRIIAESMIGGTPTTNATIAEALSVMTQRGEQWLLVNPCPEPWNSDHMLAAIRGLSVVGEQIMVAGGDPTQLDQELLMDLVTEAGHIIGEVGSFVVQLTAIVRDWTSRSMEGT